MGSYWSFMKALLSLKTFVELFFLYLRSFGCLILWIYIVKPIYKKNFELKAFIKQIKLFNFIWYIRWWLNSLKLKFELSGIQISDHYWFYRKKNRKILHKKIIYTNSREWINWSEAALKFEIEIKKKKKL